MQSYSTSPEELLVQEIEQIPDELLVEVLNFLLFLKSRHQQEKLETSLLNESSLQKDWLRPEEDEAWQDL